jgi:hypothetical protein
MKTPISETNLRTFPIPRQIVNRLMPEASDPIVDIATLDANRQVGSLERIATDRRGYYENRIREAGYQWLTIEHADGCCILYFEKLNEVVNEAAALRSRDLGVTEPPLSLTEHLRLAELWGVDSLVREDFEKAMLTTLKAEGYEQELTIHTAPVLCLFTPTDVGQMAADWAEQHGESLGFRHNPLNSTAETVEVEAVDGNIEALKVRLTEANLRFEEQAEPVEDAAVMPTETVEQIGEALTSKDRAVVISFVKGQGARSKWLDCDSTHISSKGVTVAYRNEDGTVRMADNVPLDRHFNSIVRYLKQIAKGAEKLKEAVEPPAPQVSESAVPSELYVVKADKSEGSALMIGIFGDREAAFACKNQTGEGDDGGERKVFKVTGDRRNEYLMAFRVAKALYLAGREPVDLETDLDLDAVAKELGESFGPESYQLNEGGRPGKCPDCGKPTTLDPKSDTPLRCPECARRVVKRIGGTIRDYDKHINPSEAKGRKGKIYKGGHRPKHTAKPSIPPTNNVTAAINHGDFAGGNNPKESKKLHETYTVTRQSQWSTGEDVVEISFGGLDYTNPDALSAEYAGEFEEFVDPREAAKTALEIAKQWQADVKKAGKKTKIGVAYGSTGGMTMPFSPQGRKEILAWANEEYEGLPKCAHCNEPLPDKAKRFTLSDPYDGFGEEYCSENCADQAYEFYQQEDAKVADEEDVAEGWTDSGEGPWDRQGDALDFAEAEVGVESKVVEKSDGWHVMVKADTPPKGKKQPPSHPTKESVASVTKEVADQLEDDGEKVEAAAKPSKPSKALCDWWIANPPQDAQQLGQWKTDLIAIANHCHFKSDAGLTGSEKDRMILNIERCYDESMLKLKSARESLPGYDQKLVTEMDRLIDQPEGSDLADEDEYGDAECPACGGEGVPMGTLGSLQHFRCRQCGINFSRKAPNGQTRQPWQKREGKVNESAGQDLTVDQVAREFQIDKAKAQQVIDLMAHGGTDRDAEETLEQIDNLIGGHGVEAVRDEHLEGPGGYFNDTPLLYVNMGDTYDTTICYDTIDGQFFIGSWGDFVEELDAEMASEEAEDEPIEDEGDQPTEGKKKHEFKLKRFGEATVQQISESTQKIKTLLSEAKGQQVEEGDADEQIRQSYTQWVKYGNTFEPAGDIEVKPKLERFAYRIVPTMTGIKFTKVKPRTDELYRFTSSIMERIIGEVGRFWTLKENFTKLGFMHNRGIIVYGPPGSGKSAMIQQVAEMMTGNGDVVFYSDNIAALKEGLKVFRDIEPDRKVVVVLEDADEHCNYGEREFLQLLDGADAVDNVLYLATTNYIDRFPARLLRPGRFDKKMYLPCPPIEGRRVYLEKKIGDQVDAAELERLAKETEGLSFGHLRELVIGAFALKEPIDEVLARLKARPVCDDLKPEADGPAIARRY